MVTYAELFMLLSFIVSLIALMFEIFKYIADIKKK